CEWRKDGTVDLYDPGNPIATKAEERQVICFAHHITAPLCLSLSFSLTHTPP
ncbi:putative C3 and PZP-like alpha-2-macroglobulin domain-containing protein, partial [Naja naja]